MSDTEDMRVNELLEAFFETKFRKRLPFEDARNGFGYPLQRLGLVGPGLFMSLNPYAPQHVDLAQAA